MNVKDRVCSIQLIGWLLLCFSCAEEAAVTGVVTSASPEATEAGISILKQGGNAIDAAIAVQFALGVTEPAMSGLGGGLQVLYAASGQEPIAINGTTLSPAATPRNIPEDTLTYHRRSTIPSTVKTLDFLYKNYGSGTVTWADLIEPAIKLAQDGFVPGRFRRAVEEKYAQDLSDSPYLYGMYQPSSDTIKLPVLAMTLRRLAAEGADIFYTGSIASAIATDMATNGGWITGTDLADFPEPSVRPALHTTYKDWDIYTAPPPAGGWVVLQILHMLERLSLDSIYLPVEVQLALALNAGHGIRQDRAEAAYDAAALAAVMRKDFAWTYYTEQMASEKSEEQPSGESGETTHFSVVDGDGNAVCITSSINAYFGARAVAPNLGFLYNTYMDDFVFGDTLHPDAIRPGAAAYSSMSPMIIQKDGATKLLIGSPGSARIISTVAQLSYRWMEQQIPVEHLVAQPRIHAFSGRVYLEDTNLVSPAFKKVGLEIRSPSQDLIYNGLNAYFGGVHTIAWDEVQQKWMGAADPRRDGTAKEVNEIVTPAQ